MPFAVMSGRRVGRFMQIYAENVVAGGIGWMLARPLSPPESSTAVIPAFNEFRRTHHTASLGVCNYFVQPLL
jgi:hypothetical protein